jgi:hypothetical protein
VDSPDPQLSEVATVAVMLNCEPTVPDGLVTVKVGLAKETELRTVSRVKQRTKSRKILNKTTPP